MDIHCCLFIKSTSSPLEYFPFNNIYLNIYLKEEFIFDSWFWTRHQMMPGSHLDTQVAHWETFVKFIKMLLNEPFCT